jgi:hypothetical protein
MGFMDKAKKLAEQAQQKLDEAQKNFNQSESPQAGSQEAGVRYDEHGRPIQDAPPAGAAPPPSAEPPPAAEPQPAEEAPAEAPAPEPPSGGANTAPDPFKPLQQ